MRKFLVIAAVALILALAVANVSATNGNACPHADINPCRD